MMYSWHGNVFCIIGPLGGEPANGPTDGLYTVYACLSISFYVGDRDKMNKNMQMFLFILSLSPT